MTNEIEGMLRRECFQVQVRVEMLVETDTGRWVSFKEWTLDDAEDFIEKQNEPCGLDEMFGGTGRI